MLGKEREKEGQEMMMMMMNGKGKRSAIVGFSPFPLFLSLFFFYVALSEL
jgi:hypothetical protein